MAAIQQRMACEPSPFAGQMREQRPPEFTIAGHVGVQNAQAPAICAGGGEQAALVERAVEPHQLPQATRGGRRGAGVREIEVDHEDLWCAAGFPDQQVPDVQIRVGAPGVVETP